MTYEFIGQVVATYERPFTKKNGDPGKNWEAVIEHENDGQHPARKVLVNIWDENVWNTIATFSNRNGVVKVTASVDATEWQGRWFNKINAFRAEAYQPQQQPMVQQQGFVPPVQQMQQQIPYQQNQQGNGYAPGYGTPSVGGTGNVDPNTGLPF